LVDNAEIPPWRPAACRRAGFDSGDDEDLKCEEDVKAMPPAGTPRFWALFSRSVKAEFDDEAEPATVGNCLDPY
jgi:hypothetical protein